jgi:hypothetical protein
MTNQLPPLRQSSFETMACPYAYGLVQIQGIKPPDTIQSFRGTEIHEIMAAYTQYCSARQLPADFGYFDGLLLDTGEEATAILQNCRENITIDYQNFFAAEMPMGLDENFRPTYSVLHNGEILPPDPLWGIKGSGEPTAYSGILDDIAVFPGGKAARIKDYKSHPRPFEPTTFQAKLYALMLFMFMPELDEVEFVLVFVRYPNIVRPIKFHREQVPDLKEECARIRTRQGEYHMQYLEEGQASLKAFSGTHCQYCPALTDFSCPIAKLNPMMQLSEDERLQYRLWHSTASRENNKVMSQIVQATGNAIRTADANGKMYTFGPVETEEVFYPLFDWDGAGFTMPIIEQLQTWMDTNPEDWMPNKRSPEPWLTKLKIGATELNRYLKAKKREIVHNAIKDVAVVKPTIDMKVTRDAEVDDGTGEEYSDFTKSDAHSSDSASRYEF